MNQLIPLPFFAVNTSCTLHGIYFAASFSFQLHGPAINEVGAA
jgi:hypothetical protein